MTDTAVFEEDGTTRPVAEGAELVVDLEGYEGPIDILLTLAREQKVDLTKISILALADQYLAFIAAARQLRLEIAADYLVMAAWLAYLKSRLLLPEPPSAEEPSGEELAAILTHQLRRLEAMRETGARLMALPRLDRDVFGRGAPEGLPRRLIPKYEATLLDLLRAYGTQRQRKETAVLRIIPAELYSMDDALERLRRMLGRLPEWRDLATFLPVGLAGELIERSALAATFAASLELARTGKVELRQDRAFGPIFLRSMPGAA
ncbi:MAG TPA: ScpA family protein [Stellaceae bacterium]|jgi:segregation and condensation protein A|nr:ScpA family protein [Stellaceae bacterium]